MEAATAPPDGRPGPIIEARARTEASEFLEHLAKRIGANVQAFAVFGEPVERRGITVIPVAKATWGFGGGSGGEVGKEGAGGGGGGFVSPLGYIDVSDSGAEFKPIRSRSFIAARVAAVFGIAAMLSRRLGGTARVG